MNHDELKARAIDLINAAGASLEEGRNQEALDYAEKACLAFDLLQRQRQNDEDFSDLIERSRDLYNKSSAALKEVSDGKKTNQNSNSVSVNGLGSRSAIRLENGDEKYHKEGYSIESSEADYPHVLRLTMEGQNGEVEAALKAAKWYMYPKNAFFLRRIGKDYTSEVLELLHVVLTSPEVTEEDKAQAYNLMGNYHFRPLYNNFNIDKAFEYAQKASTIALKKTSLSDSQIYDILYDAINISVKANHIYLADELSSYGIKMGLNKGLLYYPCNYFYRYDKRKSLKLGNEMLKAGCWQGLMMHAWRLINYWAKEPFPERFQKMQEFAAGPMEDYISQHPNEPGTDNLQAFACYIISKNFEPLEFMEHYRFQILVHIAQQYSPSGNYYLGCVYDSAAWELQLEGAEDSRMDEFKELARIHFTIGKDLADRASVCRFLDYIRIREGKEALNNYKDLIKAFNYGED